MQKRIDRRQAVIALAGCSAGSVAISACSNKTEEKPLTMELARAIRYEYANNDVVLCNGYVLSKSEASLWRERGLC